VWQLDGEGRGRPAVRGRTAYFLSRRHELKAVRATTGRLLWSRVTGGDGETTAGSRVIATDTRVIAGDDGIVAFDLDGRLAWRFESETARAAGTYLGDAAGPLVYAGSASGRLVALDLDTGRERWSAQVGQATEDDTTVFTPVADESTVVAGFTTFTSPTAGGIVSWDSRSGRERWRLVLPRVGVGAGLSGGPLLTARIVAAVNRDGSILVVDRATGRLVHTLPVVGQAAMPGLPVATQDFRAIAVAARGQTLIAGSLTGVIVAYDIDTGRERWRRQPIAASVGFGITVEGDTIYAPYLSGSLVALAVNDGHERWRTSPEHGFSWPPYAEGGAVYAAGSRTGFFLFVREREGGS